MYKEKHQRYPGEFVFIYTVFIYSTDLQVAVLTQEMVKCASKVKQWRRRLLAKNMAAHNAGFIILKEMTLRKFKEEGIEFNMFVRLAFLWATLDVNKKTGYL